MVKRYRNGWWLAEKYWNEGLTQREIARECDVSPRTIRKYMQKFDVETKSIDGPNHPLYGKNRSEETKQKISKTLEGRSLDSQWRRDISNSLSGRSLPKSTRQKISKSLEGIERSLETRRRMSEATAGEDNPNWQGGYSRYYGTGWGPARAKVLENHEECQECGHDGSDRRLEVHHIIPVRKFREDPNSDLHDAHRLGNLVLLCNSCHTKADFGDVSFDSTLDSEYIPDSLQNE